MLWEYMEVEVEEHVRLANLAVVVLTVDLQAHSLFCSMRRQLRPAKYQSTLMQLFSIPVRRALRWCSLGELLVDAGVLLLLGSRRWSVLVGSGQ